MPVISSSLVLQSEGDTRKNPIIGYEQLVTIANVVADSEDPNNPVTNLANPATNLIWASLSTDVQYVTVDISRADPVDYVGIAEHNFGTARIIVSVEGYAELDEEGAPIWFELAAGALATDQPALFRFAPQSLIGLRLKLTPLAVAPTLAVLYVGKLLVLPRPIYGGHTPINLGKQTRVSSNRSESGKFLGRVVLQQSAASGAQLTQLPPGWVREHLEPFLSFAEENCFFFAWRSQEYPTEVGYVWLTNDPKPVNSQPNGFMEVELSFGGIVS